MEWGPKTRKMLPQVAALQMGAQPSLSELSDE